MVELSLKEAIQIILFSTILAFEAKAETQRVALTQQCTVRKDSQREMRRRRGKRGHREQRSSAERRESRKEKVERGEKEGSKQGRKENTNRKKK